ncbi:DUF397 domain-containing protein [Streptomyces sp. NPDC018057]|uniref:DUF397 domain-containing protein n=1 Tax=unclassified Streptomyces TaxID=2593676 RepID=UPI00379FB548
MIETDIWRKSSYSGGGEGNACVEVSPRPARTAVRDSKTPGGAVLSFPSTAFAAFAGGLRAASGRPGEAEVWG